MPSRETEDQRQFREYFAARREVVRRTAYVLCGDWHWADDLTQTAFMRLAVSWRKVRDQQSLDAYVRTCLVRTYLSEAGRMSRRREWSTAGPRERAGAGRPDGSYRAGHVRWSPSPRSTVALLSTASRSLRLLLQEFTTRLQLWFDAKASSGH